jgi:hypothetical protein
VHLWGQAGEGDVDNHEREVSGEDIEKGRERERRRERYRRPRRRERSVGALSTRPERCGAVAEGNQ